MIETVVTVDLMVEEELRIKKNRLAPDFPNGDEKRICIEHIKYHCGCVRSWFWNVS